MRITTTAIFGSDLHLSDLHLYDGYFPTMQEGDIHGHEFIGEVVALGKEVTNLKIGDRGGVPFTISCGGCCFCQKQFWSLSNPNDRAWLQPCPVLLPMSLLRRTRRAP